MTKFNRRDFLKKGAIAGLSGSVIAGGTACDDKDAASKQSYQAESVQQAAAHPFNGIYQGENLHRIAFPLGGLGAGMVCLEGQGCLSHISVRNTPDIFNEPFMFSAISLKGIENGAKVMEGPVPPHKIFGNPGTGDGARGLSYGFPRFDQANFLARFPFAQVALQDQDIPLDVKINGWSPFIPSDSDDSGLPVGSLEYQFKNTSGQQIEGVFSTHAYNFMRIEIPSEFGGRYEPGSSIGGIKNGFILQQSCLPGKAHYKGDFAVFSSEEAVVDHSLFQGGWFDARTIIWRDIVEGRLPNDQIDPNSVGASLYVPFSLAPGQEKTISLLMCWYVPHSNVRRNDRLSPAEQELGEKQCDSNKADCCDPAYTSLFYEPYYSARFTDVREVADYWLKNYNTLKSKSEKFRDSFYAQTLPDEVLEAIAANLTILKSPTVLRQKDGRLWNWEGCHDYGGCCHGSCTHVWNYAQAISRLFPDLERTLRETEFFENQNDAGHQTFRASLPIDEVGHGFHAAADGQLGGIMKAYREWRISGDNNWLKRFWPKVKGSMDYCINTWDPMGKGILEEPHHNTYDIEFWGPDGMCTSFYLGALKATVKMGQAMGHDTARYQQLLDRGKKYMEEELFDGEYFIQKIVWEGLRTPSPLDETQEAWNVNYSKEALELLKKEGPKYQYGIGCLSDGILGCWIAQMSGLEDFIDGEKVRSHLRAIHKHNFKTNLSDHANPQRPSYAYGNEGGLLLCTWPKGGKLTLPFVYSNEVWTGIEYQVAAHLMSFGEIEKGLDIVREVRKRYDGKVRNPFDEYECGHWYARALSSFGMIQGLTGLQYDGVDQALYIDSKIGDTFTGFISNESGFGLAGLDQGKPFMKVVHGDLKIKSCYNAGEKSDIQMI